MDPYWHGFSHGWLACLVTIGVWFYFDSRRWHAKHRELEAKQQAINRRIDELIDPLGH